MTAPEPGLRIDKWLWHARFFKTRSLAAKVVSTYGCRVNGPAPEAQALYEDLAPLERTARTPTDPAADRVGGRPTKKDRRALDALDKGG